MITGLVFTKYIISKLLKHANLLLPKLTEKNKNKEDMKISLQISGSFKNFFFYGVLSHLTLQLENERS